MLSTRAILKALAVAGWLALFGCSSQAPGGADPESEPSSSKSDETDGEKESAGAAHVVFIDQRDAFLVIVAKDTDEMAREVVAEPRASSLVHRKPALT